MKVTYFQRVEYYLVEMDDGHSYRRSVDGNGDCWERLYGESWEMEYSMGPELDVVFNDYMQHLFK